MGQKPNRITEEVWNNWTAHWSFKQVHRKRVATSRNRCSETSGEGSGPSLNTRDSIYMVKRVRRMAHELGRDPDPIELFKAMHTRQTLDGDHYHKLVESASQPTEESTQPAKPDTMELFLQAADGEKKHHIYGLGAKALSFSHYSSCSSTTRSQGTDIPDPSL
ncbi:uncharacterized protein LOC107260990 [Ricinus communis]|uniref:uncharacterized protein LOC107260990 n=1 Tax=Ricinus communis TaxID=3988 RepID=UPI00201B1FC8|nr:uncharacterized protein LOC107260990 [Ricinus communis]